MFTTVLRGLAAGAAGVTALNTATYLDMAVRGRAASSAPSDVVEALLTSAGGDVPGDGDTRDNRLEALGPLSGTLAGLAVGTLASLLHRVGLHLPRPVAVVALGASAMVLADGPLALTGISDPRDWSSTEWMSDAIPHLVFGLVTYQTLTALEAASRAVADLEETFETEPVVVSLEATP